MERLLIIEFTKLQIWLRCS